MQNLPNISLLTIATLNILIISPSLNLHGGIRVLVEWANGLARRGHYVTFQSQQGYFPNGKDGKANKWIEIHPSVEFITDKVEFPANAFDVAIAGSYQVAHFLNAQKWNCRKYCLIQMCEELFHPDNKAYVKQVTDAYRLPMPLICISKWNIDRILNEHARNPEYPIHYVGNGVTNDFKPGEKDKTPTILVEGWIGYNFAKDTEAIGAKVAKRLKEKYIVRILAYSQLPKDEQRFGNLPILQYQNIPDEYYLSPNTKQITSLYQRAHLVIKASRYDARACAPVEAMKCGTPTARAIIEGDDDLIHGLNCLRCGYNEDELFAISERLLLDEKLRAELVENGFKYAEKMLDWDYWMQEIEKIISQ